MIYVTYSHCYNENTFLCSLLHLFLAYCDSLRLRNYCSVRRSCAGFVFFVCLNKWKQMLISFFRPAVKHVLGLGDPKLIPRGTAVVKCSHMSMENMNLQHPVVASVLNLFPVQFASCTFLEHSSVNKTIEFLKNKKKKKPASCLSWEDFSTSGWACSLKLGATNNTVTEFMLLVLTRKFIYLSV